MCAVCQIKSLAACNRACIVHTQACTLRVRVRVRVCNRLTLSIHARVHGRSTTRVVCLCICTALPPSFPATYNFQHAPAPAPFNRVVRRCWSRVHSPTYISRPPAHVAIRTLQEWCLFAHVVRKQLSPYSVVAVRVSRSFECVHRSSTATRCLCTNTHVAAAASTCNQHLLGWRLDRTAGMTAQYL